MSPEKPIQDVVIYTRQSQGEEGSASLEEQEERCREWAETNDVTVVDVLVDAGLSRGIDPFDRPGCAHALEAVKSGKAQAVVCMTLDRFSGNLEGALPVFQYLERGEGHAGTLIALDLPFQGGDTETGELMRTMLLALATWQLKRTTRLIYAGKMRGVRAGKTIGPTPFGYLRDEVSRLLTPHPVEAPIVREAFRVAAEQGPRAAAEYLDDVTPADRRFNTQAARRLLRNRTYLGEARFGDNTVRRVKRDDGVWVRRLERNDNPVVIRDAHEPLVDRTTFDRAQHEPEVGHRAPAKRYPLARVCACNRCDTTLVGSTYSRHKSRVYRCGSGGRTSAAANGPCGPWSVLLADELEEYVRAELVRIAATERPTETAVLVEAGGGAQGASRLIEATHELKAAEHARDRDLKDLGLTPELLQIRLQAHDEALAAAREYYEEALTSAQPEVSWPLVDEVNAADLDELAVLIEKMGLRITVSPDRGDTKERVRIDTCAI